MHTGTEQRCWGGGVGGESTDNGRSHTFRERRKVAKLQILRASRYEKIYHKGTWISRDKVN